MRHLLSIDELRAPAIVQLLDTAQRLQQLSGGGRNPLPLLAGRTVVNLFFEASTRTRTTFELAAKRLGAEVVNLDVAGSSASKGEGLLDTLATLHAMHADLFVVRHSASGAAHFIASQFGDRVSVLNAGDGRHAHPTQALLDMYTIRQHKGDFSQLKVGIVGDVLHSRVARSNLQALHALRAAEVRLIGPYSLMPPDVAQFGVQHFINMDAGMRGLDVVIMLRLQRERMRSAFLPSEREYFYQYGLTADRLALAANDCIVMHPGPMNRGVEIASEVADGPRSVILDQVQNGVAVRMAVMATVLGADLSPYAALDATP